MSKILNNIIEDQTYQYFSIFFGTFFLLPQIYKGIQRKSLSDLSSISLIMISTGGILWCLFMYETKRILFFSGTLFLTCCSLTLLILQCMYYQQRVMSSMRKIDNPVSVTIDK